MRARTKRRMRSVTVIAITAIVALGVIRIPARNDPAGNITVTETENDEDREMGNLIRVLREFGEG